MYGKINANMLKPLKLFSNLAFKISKLEAVNTGEQRVAADRGQEKQRL